MAFYFFTGMIIAALLGVFLNYILYKNGKNHNEDKYFWSSEKFLTFLIEIIIAVVGFGLTLNFSNENERKREEEVVIQMLEQAKQYTEDLVEFNVTNYQFYDNNEYDWVYLEHVNTVNLNYYNNILTDPQVIRQVDMFVYGYMMQCLLWVEREDEYMRSLEDEELAYRYMKFRDQNIYKIELLLDICIKELKGEIDEEEAEKLCYAYRAITFDIKAGEHGTNLENIRNADEDYNFNINN